MTTRCRSEPVTVSCACCEWTWHGGAEAAPEEWALEHSETCVPLKVREAELRGVRAVLAALGEVVDGRMRLLEGRRRDEGGKTATSASERQFECAHFLKMLYQLDPEAVEVPDAG